MTAAGRLCAGGSRINRPRSVLSDDDTLSYSSTFELSEQVKEEDLETLEQSESADTCDLSDICQKIVMINLDDDDSMEALKRGLMSGDERKFLEFTAADKAETLAESKASLRKYGREKSNNSDVQSLNACYYSKTLTRRTPPAVRVMDIG